MYSLQDNVLKAISEFDKLIISVPQGFYETDNNRFPNFTTFGSQNNLQLVPC